VQNSAIKRDCSPIAKADFRYEKQISQIEFRGLSQEFFSDTKNHLVSFRYEISLSGRKSNWEEGEKVRREIPGITEKILGIEAIPGIAILTEFAPEPLARNSCSPVTEFRFCPESRRMRSVRRDRCFRNEIAESTCF